VIPEFTQISASGRTWRVHVTYYDIVGVSADAEYKNIYAYVFHVVIKEIKGYAFKFCIICEQEYENMNYSCSIDVFSYDVNAVVVEFLSTDDELWSELDMEGLPEFIYSCCVEYVIIEEYAN